MTHFYPEPADASERALLERAAQWDGARNLAELTPELLVEVMRREGVGCLPVVTKDGKLCGMVTSRNLLGVASELLEQKLKDMKPKGRKK